jgi:hypothetical protein
MLFLLNAAVVRTQFQLELPRGLEPLAQATPAGVLQAGAELYAKHPKLERERPDIARWYCTLLQQKYPDMGAARFQPTARGYVAQLAPVPLRQLVRLLSLQNEGVDIAHEVQATVWAQPLPA